MLIIYYLLYRRNCSAALEQSNMPRRERNAEAPSRTSVAYRAARQNARSRPTVSGGVPTRNVPSVSATIAVSIPRAQRSGHKHRSPARLLCDPPRCATTPEGCPVPYSRLFCPLESHLRQAPAQPGVAVDRCAREIVGFLKALLRRARGN